MSDHESENTLVQMKDICKSFGGVKALDHVSFDIRRGEIHALMGENGAGKSTLMKILSGAYTLDSGEIYIDGKEVRIHSPKDGIENGVSVIYQEFALVNSLTVAENIFIDNLCVDRKTIEWKKLYRKADDLLESVGFGSIPSGKPVEELSVARQQVVEICKALARNASILILDEPTAVLASNEVENLFRVLNNLRERGVAIVYISHRLDEIFRLADRITVMKDGTYVGTYNKADITEQELVNRMIGRKLESYFPSRESHIGEEIFRVENIVSEPVVHDVSFSVREGEVFGITGLVGAGRTELVRAIYGADHLDSGKIFIFGRKVTINNPRQAVKLGLGMLSEDRKATGVLLNLPIRQNITLNRLKVFLGKFFNIKKKEETQYVGGLVDRLAIKLGSIEDEANSLSGGNQQKVAIAKFLATDPKVLILDEPTRGVDVGAKIEIYKIINEMADQGYAIIMISSEMIEIIGMCDRALVMRNGEAMATLEKEELTEQNIINYAMGVKQDG